MDKSASGKTASDKLEPDNVEFMVSSTRYYPSHYLVYPAPFDPASRFMKLSLPNFINKTLNPVAEYYLSVDNGFDKR